MSLFGTPVAHVHLLLQCQNPTRVGDVQDGTCGALYVRFIRSKSVTNGLVRKISCPKRANWFIISHKKSVPQEAD